MSGVPRVGALGPTYGGHADAFAAGCALSSSYGFLSGAWPFGVVEAIWTVVALRRYLATRPPDEPAPGPL